MLKLEEVNVMMEGMLQASGDAMPEILWGKGRTFTRTKPIGCASRVSSEVRRRRTTHRWSSTWRKVGAKQRVMMSGLSGLWAPVKLLKAGQSSVHLVTAWESYIEEH